VPGKSIEDVAELELGGSDKDGERRTGLSAGRVVGLYEAKSERKTQFQDVTSTFSQVMSPWHTPAPCAWATASSSWYATHSCGAATGTVTRQPPTVARGRWAASDYHWPCSCGNTHSMRNTGTERVISSCMVHEVKPVRSAGAARR